MIIALAKAGADLLQRNHLDKLPRDYAFTDLNTLKLVKRLEKRLVMSKLATDPKDDHLPIRDKEFGYWKYSEELAPPN